MSQKYEVVTIKSLLIWLLRQNAFVVVALMVSILFFGSKTLAYLGENPETPSKQTAFSNSQKNYSQAIAPSPTTKKSPTKKPTPKPTLTPKPTNDPDPFVNCIIPENCGGESIRMRTSECDAKICCDTGGGNYESLSRDECSKKWNEYQDEQWEKQKKELDEQQRNFQKSIDDFLETSRSYNSQSDESDQESEAKKQADLEYYNNQCKDRALSDYNQDKADLRQKFASLNTLGSSGYGSYEWAVSKLDSEYQRTVSNCDASYPTD